MKNSLFLICPTDYLETVINNSFEGNNYFFTSLGNSVDFNYGTMLNLERLIRKRNITKVFFILSNNNPIIKDALQERELSEIRRMEYFYRKIYQMKKKSDASWQLQNHKYLILSYFLDKRMKELQGKLNTRLNNKVKINTRIYNQKARVFTDTYSSLIRYESLALN